MNGYTNQPITQSEKDYFFAERLNRGSAIIDQTSYETSGLITTSEMDTSLMDFDPYSTEDD